MQRESVLKLLTTTMPFARVSKHVIIGRGFPGQLQQVRRHAPISGPPRYPLTTAQRAIYGWGSLLVMMIIPVWTLFSIPRWSAMHNNLPYDEDETEQPQEE